MAKTKEKESKRAISTLGLFLLINVVIAMALWNWYASIGWAVAFFFHHLMRNIDGGEQ